MASSYILTCGGYGSKPDDNCKRGDPTPASESDWWRSGVENGGAGTYCDEVWRCWRLKPRSPMTWFDLCLGRRKVSGRWGKVCCTVLRSLVGAWAAGGGLAMLVASASYTEGGSSNECEDRRFNTSQLCVGAGRRSTTRYITTPGKGSWRSSRLDSRYKTDHGWSRRQGTVIKVAQSGEKSNVRVGEGERSELV